ncbi:MAG: hypothetical protein EBT97_11510 [Actinobacteria bacterium]|nr:hypothetical protein [Actinomycetota bacterium]
MTDLAADLAALAPIIDAIGVRRADLLGLCFSGWENHVTIHVRGDVASRVVLSHGDVGTLSELTHAPEGTVPATHSRVTLRTRTSTGRAVQILWVTQHAAV